MSSLGRPDLEGLIGRRVELAGHFEGVVIIESVRSLGSGAELRVRLTTGELDEAIVSEEDLCKLLGGHAEEPGVVRPVDPEKLRLLIESARIRLAYTYDKQFAVSVSGIAEPLTQTILCALVVGQERRLGFARHVPEDGAGDSTFGVLHDARHAIHADKAIETLRVDPLDELAVVRVERDLSFHTRTLHQREMRDRVYSDGPGSPLWIDALPRLREFSHQERLLSIAKSRLTARRPKDVAATGEPNCALKNRAKKVPAGRAE